MSDLTTRSGPTGPGRDEPSDVLTAINDLWFEWSPSRKGPRGRGSAEYTRAVAQEARNALVRLLTYRASLIPPPSDDEPFAEGFATAIKVIHDVEI